MSGSAFALWLDTFFQGYDMAILGLCSSLASVLGFILTPLMKLITLLGEKGLLFFLLALVLMCFSKTRRYGVCIFGAVCCGALITNIILKDTVARARPFEAVLACRQWWESIGSPNESGFSFPSGHVTAAASGCTALCLLRGKKLVVPSVIWVLLMAFSRNYLMAHYPSDVLFAAIIGVGSGFAAWYITRFIYDFLEGHRNMGLCRFALEYSVPLDTSRVNIPYLPRLSASIAYLSTPEESEPDPRRSSPDRGRSRSRAEYDNDAAPTRRSYGHDSKPAGGTAKRKSSFSPSGMGYKGKHDKIK